MHISKYLRREGVIARLAARDKQSALEELAEAASAAGLDRTEALAVLLERESLGSTALGGGYAVPHGTLPGLDGIFLLFARSVEGLDFGAGDGELCRFFFVVLTPEGVAGLHLGLLGTIARLAKDPSFTARLAQARDAAELTEFLLTV
jgi:PTS system nitrogen regulatory IIA component